jgi:hypothetical protein
MEVINIRVRDPKKANVLRKFLKTLDYVESVSSEETNKKQPVSQSDETAFFALAGLWAGRDITQESLRKKAWPERV